MSAQRPTPAQLKALEAADDGRAVRVVGTERWLRTRGSVRCNTLDRVLADGLLEPYAERRVGETLVQEFRPSASGREALYAAWRKASA